MSDTKTRDKYVKHARRLIHMMKYQNKKDYNHYNLDDEYIAKLYNQDIAYYIKMFNPLNLENLINFYDTIIKIFCQHVTHVFIDHNFIIWQYCLIHNINYIPRHIETELAKSTSICYRLYTSDLIWNPYMTTFKEWYKYIPAEFTPTVKQYLSFADKSKNINIKLYIKYIVETYIIKSD